MGGKVLKPKIQAYVEQRWFDEFEVYRSLHDLNASKALERILAEFFSSSSSPTSPSTELETAIAPTMIDALRAELAELKQGLEQRLQLVESRLAIESAAPQNGLASESTVSQAESAVALKESADELALTQTESATGSNRLADESAIFLVDLDPNPVESLANLLNESASESAVAEDEPAESAASSAIESAIGEDAIAFNPTEEVAPVEVEEDEIASDSAEFLKPTEKSITPVILSKDAIACNSEDVSEPTATSDTDSNPPHPQKGITASALTKRLGLKAVSSVTRRPERESERRFKSWSRKLDPDGIAWVSGPGEGRSPVLYYSCLE